MTNAHAHTPQKPDTSQDPQKPQDPCKDSEGIRREFASLISCAEVGDGRALADLLASRSASRLASRDAAVFGLPEQAAKHAARFMGWVDLCTDPPVDPQAIMSFAADAHARGLSDVVLIGQGGSSQAPMTMAALLAARDQLPIRFHTLDSLSPRAFRSIMDALDPAGALFVVSSKSGSTIEPNALLACAWEWMEKALGVLGSPRAHATSDGDAGDRAAGNGLLSQGVGSHFVAITDPGSSLEALARERGFARVFAGQPDVGGRFSALSVFGLVPFALMGIDVAALLADCAEAQRACSIDDAGNPASRLAAFLVDAQTGSTGGYRTLLFSFSDATRAFGLWLEQLIAESLGKKGKGILPCSEPDSVLVSEPRDDCRVVVYGLGDEAEQIAARCASIDAAIPRIELRISEPRALARHFVLWEYATAFAGMLLGVNPFDQPDVESTKQAVRDFLAAEASDLDSDTAAAAGAAEVAAAAGSGTVEVSKALTPFLAAAAPSGVEAAASLFATAVAQSAYGSINAFVPDCDEDASAALEALRQAMAVATGRPICLERGPRYLHSIGQFQKGGPNVGTILILSIAESEDRAVPGQRYRLGQLAATQARGDFKALDDAGRRAIHVFLPAPDWGALRVFAERFAERFAETFAQTSAEAFAEKRAISGDGKQALHA